MYSTTFQSITLLIVKLALQQSQLAPTALDPLQLLATSSEFPDGACMLVALYPLHLPYRSLISSPHDHL